MPDYPETGACMPTALELFAGAPVITVGSSISAIKSTDTLYYTFSAVAGTRYQIDVEGISSGGGSFHQPHVYVYDGPTATNLITSDKGRGVGLDARVHHIADDTGTIYLRLDDANRSDPGGTFKISVKNATNDDDHGDNSGTASSLGFGSTVNGELEIVGDSDWFAVNLTAGNIYTVDLKGESNIAGTLLDPYLRLYDNSGTMQVASDDDSGFGNNAQITYSPTSSGTYYVKAMSGGLPQDYVTAFSHLVTLQPGRENTDPGTYGLSITETASTTGTNGVTISDVDLGVFRFFNSGTGTHFYSPSYTEAVSINENLPSYVYESVAFKSVASTDAGAIEFHRFFNTATGTHFFTSNAAEKDNVIATLPQFNYEGVAYYLHGTQDSDDIGLHRLFNTETGTHFYTANAVEKDNVISTLSQFNYEGIVGYVDIA